jgi:RHS repeat-associated protein
LRKPLWAKVTQNRPAWIFGINGFAVEVISATGHFHRDPYADFSSGRNRKYTDQDFVWTIDGYDVCNRMFDFFAPYARNAFGGNKYVDVIRLLRSDGTVLRLQNVQPAGGPTDQPTASNFYIGHYYVDEPNSSGYGLVDFDSTYWPQYIRKYVPTDDRSLIPRVLRYFPGDGLEYVFKERVAPFGLWVFRDSAYGGMRASPTIFYLEQIKTESGASFDLRWQRHDTILHNIAQTSSGADSSKGHSLLAGYSGTTITHDHDILGADLHARPFYTIQSLGRTFTVYYDTVAPGGNGTSFILPRTDYGDRPDYSSSDRFQYQSPLGYVTMIIDPEGRKTTFDYQKYATTYVKFGMPGHDTIAVNNYRLTEVKEPFATFEVAYKPSISVVDTGSLGIAALLSNVADTVQKYGPDGQLQTTTRYQLAYKLLSDSPREFSVDSCEVFQTDNISGRSGKTTFFYKPYVISDTSLFSDIPRPRFTSLYKTVNVRDSITTASYVQYGNSLASDTVALWGTPYLILPTATWTTVNGIRTSLAKFSYTTTVARMFAGNTNVANLLGREVSMKVTSIYRPDSTATLLLRDTTTYLQMPLVYSAVSRSDTLWDESRSYHTLNTIEKDRTWYEYMLKPGTDYSLVQTTGYKWLPPIFGLPTSSLLYDASGRLLAGHVVVYDTNSYTARVMRGKVLSDTIVGRDGKKILGSVYDYRTWWGRNVPGTVKNAVGAQATVYYDYRTPWLMNDTGGYTGPSYSFTCNDDVARSATLDASPYFGYVNEVPLAGEVGVRRFDGGGTLRVDTMTTYSALTFFGNPSQVIDPNGNSATVDYDWNGRPTLSHLPFDFSDDSVNYTGTKNVYFDLAGTDHTHVEDSLNCTAGTHTQVTLTDLNDTMLFASAPVFTSQSCSGGGHGGGSTVLMKQASTSSTIKFTSKEENVAHLRVAVNTARGTGFGAVSLDSAYISLLATSASATWVQVSVSIPQLKITQWYVLRVPKVGRFVKGTSGTLQSSAPSGYRFKIDLTDVKDSVLALTPGSILNIYIKDVTSGSRVTFAMDDDAGPRLVLKGSFREYRPIKDRNKDYSVGVAYDDDARSATVNAKVDDPGHSSDQIDPGVLDKGARRTLGSAVAGVDGRALQMFGIIGNPASPLRIDTVSARYAGDGRMMSTTSPIHDSVSLGYDAAGRAIRMINVDGTHSDVAYYFGTPASCGITDATQDFFGFCSATVATDEVGTKSAAYYDVFGRLRRVVVDSGSGGLKLTTKFEYDVLDRPTSIINPRGDTIRYWYDDFGRPAYVKHPDFGIASAVYDVLGNLRFSQTQAQADSNRLTFNEYDDLNRITLVGEATIAFFDSVEHGGGGGGGSRTARGPVRNRKKGLGSTLLSGPGDGPGVTRMIDTLDPNYLHDLASSGILTSNVTVFQVPLRPLPDRWSDAQFDSSDCKLLPDLRQGETSAPATPTMVHPALRYEPVTSPGANLDEFEHVAKYPHFVRMAVAYDTLPSQAGAVWGGLPTSTRLDSLAPSGTIRNIKGRPVAVAYREHGGEPFHYWITSYDARGRVEALIHYTENLGYDALYYTYNSFDEVTTVRTVDPQRQHTTWYGYDHNGRVDSIWTELSASGGGLGIKNPHYTAGPSRPTDADIVYAYNRLSQVDSMQYPPVGLTVRYFYDSRRWLDSMIAQKSGTEMFREQLGYDSTGLIVNQTSKLNGQPTLTQDYDYDGTQRLTRWLNGTDTTRYTYDEVGNRKTDTVGTHTRAFNLAPTADGPDRLEEVVSSDGGAITGRRSYTYNPDGAVTSAKDKDSTNTVTGEGHLDYSWRGLVRRYIAGTPGGEASSDWRYRYGPGGEREQKRLYDAPGGDSLGNTLSWTYYSIGLGNTQMAVYHGQQTVDAPCVDTGSRVYMYPTEYLTYGLGRTSNVISYPNGFKDYRVVDHEGSTRLTYSSLGALSGRYDYDPFGKVVTGVPPRLGYIHREKDLESGLGDFGVRKYNDEEGRFWSVDALWRLTPNTSPYSYSGNSPLSKIDPSGLIGENTIYPSPVGDTPLDPTPPSGGGGGYSAEDHLREREDEYRKDGNDQSSGGGSSHGNGGQFGGAGSTGRWNPKDPTPVFMAPTIIVEAPYPSLLERVVGAYEMQMRIASDLASDVWNSEAIRMIVPDRIDVNFSAGATLGAGVSSTFSVVWLTRGPDASGLPYTFVTPATGIGADISASAGVQVGYFTGDKDNIRARDIAGWSGSYGVGVAFGGKVSYNGSFSTVQRGGKDIGTWITQGGSIGISPPTVGSASYYVGYSVPLSPSIRTP